MNRAPFSYFGGKYRLLDYLQAHLPPLKDVDYYVEPFFGSGTLFFSRDGLGMVEVINDYNSYIYNFFKILRDKKPALIERLKYTPYSVETFLEARAWLAQGGKTVRQSHRSIPIKDQVYAAWALYVVYTQSVMNTGRTFARSDRNRAREFMQNQSRLEYCSRRLCETTIENEDALKVLERYDSRRTFVYLDPPYLNVRNVTGMKQSYHGNDGNELHERLLDWCLSAKSMIMISNYPNELYDQTLASWNREEIIVNVNAAAGKRGLKRKVMTAIEMIWTSPNTPQQKQLGLFHE